MGVEGYGDNIVGVRRYFLFNIFIEDMKNFFWFVINMVVFIGLLGFLIIFVFLFLIEEGCVGYVLGFFLIFFVYLLYIIDSLFRILDFMFYLIIYIVI